MKKDEWVIPEQILPEDCDHSMEAWCKIPVYVPDAHSGVLASPSGCLSFFICEARELSTASPVCWEDVVKSHGNAPAGGLHLGSWQLYYMLAGKMDFSFLLGNCILGNVSHGKKINKIILQAQIFLEKSSVFTYFIFRKKLKILVIYNSK